MAYIDIARGLTLVYEGEPTAPEPGRMWLMFEASSGERDGINIAASVGPIATRWAKDRILEYLAARVDRARDITPPDEDQS